MGFAGNPAVAKGRTGADVKSDVRRREKTMNRPNRWKRCSVARRSYCTAKNKREAWRIAAPRRHGRRIRDAWPTGVGINSLAKYFSNKTQLGESSWLDLFAHIVGPMWRVSCVAAVAGHYVQPQRSEAQC